MQKKLHIGLKKFSFLFFIFTFGNYEIKYTRQQKKFDTLMLSGWLQLTMQAPRIGELRTQKLKSHLVRTQSLNVLPLKSGVGQYIAIHETLIARNFFLAYFYPSGPFTCIFSKTSQFFPVLAEANTGSCVGPQNKLGHPVGCRFPC